MSTFNGINEQEMKSSSFVDSQKKQGSKIETVIKVSDRNNTEDGGTIIDEQNNEYVLNRPSDTTIHYEDTALLSDVIELMIGSFVGGFVCNLFHVPGINYKLIIAFFGYVSVGILLGPGGYDKIKNLIQIETISQFGVIFILFFLGLEFKVDKIRSSWKICATIVGVTLSMIILYHPSEFVIFSCHNTTF